MLSFIDRTGMRMWRSLWFLFVPRRAITLVSGDIVSDKRSIIIGPKQESIIIIIWQIERGRKIDVKIEELKQSINKTKSSFNIIFFYFKYCVHFNLYAVKSRSSLSMTETWDVFSGSSLYRFSRIFQYEKKKQTRENKKLCKY